MLVTVTSRKRVRKNVFAVTAPHRRQRGMRCGNRNEPVDSQSALRRIVRRYVCLNVLRDSSLSGQESEAARHPPLRHPDASPPFTEKLNIQYPLHLELNCGIAIRDVFEHRPCLKLFYSFNINPFSARSRNGENNSEI